MPTIGEALGALEARLFVGREADLGDFRRWLDAAQPTHSILNVSGPGGIGKSALLGAFARAGLEAGRTVVAADGQDIVPPTPDALRQALGGGEWAEVVARINEARGVLMLDTFEAIEELTPFLQQELLPSLDTATRVVIAGRYPLGRAWGGWQGLVRPLPLRGLSSEESLALLGRRGITDSRLVGQIGRAAGGLPLALSLAADMVQQLGVRRFGSLRDWPLAVRSMVERLLQGVDDPVLRELIEACSVLRQFDEQTLAAVSGRTEIGPAFDRLCRLSVVRPAERGLSLHDDVQRILADDLRWRRPARHRDLRLRALAHYRERAREAPPGEREWLVAERLYLWGNELIQDLMFRPDTGDEVHLEPGDPSTLPEIQEVWRGYQGGFAEGGLAEGDPSRSDGGTPEGGAWPAGPEGRRWLEALVMEPSARLRMARTPDGRAVGYSASISVYRGSIDLLLAHPVFAPLLEAYLGPEGIRSLPGVADDSPYHYLLQAATASGAPRSAEAALLRDVIGLLASGGVYLATVASAPRKRLCGALGFQPVAAARTDLGPGLEPAEGFMLDLRTVGVERWVDALVQGHPSPRGLTAPEVERELQAVLPRWAEDDVLVRSSLVELAPPDGPRTADAVREVVRSALARARAGGRDQEMAYRAVELAYLDRSVSHERVAERLAVSRSTFYRLLKRGVRGLARAIAEP